MWDVFCSVVDNYGDVAVCWRLAQELHAEHGLDVRLWVDDLATLARIEPRLRSDAALQELEGVSVRAWVRPFPNTAPGDVVVEGFGCTLPEAFVEEMARRAPSPVWINLEYLSAEAWVAGYHGLPSPHPRLPLLKQFFFPGFGPGTGGVLRERNLLSERDTAEAPPSDRLRISLFCYPHAPLAPLLELWSQSSQAIECLVPEERIVSQIAHFFGRQGAVPGGTYERGALAVTILPFTDQRGYDRLLWRSSCNFVRGEDSFVRAQWAARPLVWQPYPQSDESQLVKMEAFLTRYCEGLAPSAADALARFMRFWNSAEPARREIPQAWADFVDAWPELEAHARRWCERLRGWPELAAELVKFAQRVK